MVSGEAITQLKTGKYFPLQPYLVVISGALCMAAVGPSYLHGQANSLLQLVGMALLALCLVIHRDKTLSLTWLFASTWIASSVWWLYIALHDVGKMPAVVALVAIALLSTGLGFYYAAAFWLRKHLDNQQNGLLSHLLFASCWTVAELARAQWFTGFPWSAIGYAHVNHTLSYLAPWVGVYGIGFIAAFIASWCATSLLRTHQGKHTNKMLVLVLAIVALPTWRSNDDQGISLSVNLLQGNIDQIAKYTSERQKALRWYADELLNSEADLTVLPEIGIPYFQQELPADYWAALEKKFASGNQVALIGMPTLGDVAGYGNSAVGLGFGRQQQYDKHHLVPFGEFTPATLKWFTSMMVNEMGEFNRGDLQQPPFSWKNNHISVTICYEDLFGEELAARFVGAAPAPTLFVNMSNIAWFGNTMVVSQHLDIARMRSLEFDRPTVRATNTGATAYISAQGEVISQLPAFTENRLKTQVNGKQGSITWYAFWAGHWGLMPLWALCALVILTSAIVNRARQKISVCKMNKC